MEEDQNSYFNDLFLNQDYQEDCFEHEGQCFNYFCLKSSTSDYDLTGQIVWQAAKLLGIYILENKELFQDKLVLELGAGAGLSGIVCSKFAKRTILTDGNQIVFDLLKRNCLLYPNKTEAFLLNWGKTQIDDLIQQTQCNFEIIIGADILFWPSSIGPLVEVIESVWERNKDSKFIFCTCKRSVFAENNFDSLLKERNFERIYLQSQGDIVLYEVKKV